MLLLVFLPLTRFHLVQLLADGLVLLVLRPHFQPFIQDSEGVFPFTASMDSEAIKAFLIDLSRLPGAEETAEKAQKIAPTN